MSYEQDPVYQTVRWLRAKTPVDASEPFSTVFANAWSRWAHVAPRDVKVRIGLINYKPFERARIMADVSFVPGRHGSSVVTLNLFLHAFANSEAARGEVRASTERELLCCYGPPVIHLEDHRLVVWTLPNAPNLLELRELLNPEGFRGLLSRVPALAAIDSFSRGPTLVRYVPMKRAILTWTRPVNGPRYFLKVIEGPESAVAALNLFEIHAHAAHGALGFAVPQPIRYCPDLHTMMMSEVPGHRFTAAMAEARPEAFADVGKALASLHGLAATPAKIWSPERELADLCRHMKGLKQALPALARRLDAVLERLDRPPVVTSYVSIHGNLFGDQILYNETAPSRRVGIVDWDAWSLGDRHFDLGRLIAHFLYLAKLGQLPSDAVADCVTSLLTAYEEAGGGPLDRRSLEWHIVVALLLRAKISSLRKLRPGWPRHFDLMVTEAERILDGDSPAPKKISHSVKHVAPPELAAP